VSARGKSTGLIHHPYRAPEGFESPAVPVAKGSSVFFPNVAALRSRTWLDRSGYTYGLHGTPTSFTLEERLATLEGGRYAQLVPSGLAAISLVDMALLASGDQVLLPDNAYGPNKTFARHELAAWGITHALYDPLDAASLERAITPTTRLVWLEAPGSVTLEFPDLRGLVRLVRERAPQAVIVDFSYAAAPNGVVGRDFDRARPIAWNGEPGKAMADLVAGVLGERGLRPRLRFRELAHLELHQAERHRKVRAEGVLGDSQGVVDGVPVDEDQQPGAVVDHEPHAPYADILVEAVAVGEEPGHGAKRLGQRPEAAGLEILAAQHEDRRRGRRAPLLVERGGRERGIEQRLQGQVADLHGILGRRRSGRGRCHGKDQGHGEGVEQRGRRGAVSVSARRLH